MITQSGTVGCIFLEQAAELGVSKFVSYGNRTDVDEADLLAYLADDPETDIIAMYVEGLEDGRKLLETAKIVTQKKPVVVLKVGRTERGARASMSHTGFFGGSYGVVQGAFRQAGMIPVDSMEELGGEQGAGDAAEGAGQPRGDDQQRRRLDGAGDRPAQAERAGDARAERGDAARPGRGSTRRTTSSRTRST